MTRTSCDCEECVAELLRDLMHWADQARIDFDAELHRARFHYVVAVADQEAVA